MSIIDLIILIPLAWFGFKGFRNGLVKEVVSMVGFALGIFLAFNNLQWASEILKNSLGIEGAWAPIIAFILLLILFMAIVQAIIYALNLIIKITMLSLPNRILGTAFGSLKAAIMVSAISIPLLALNVPGPETRNSSLLYPIIAPVAPIAFNVISVLYPRAENFQDEVGRYLNEFNPLNLNVEN